MKVKKFWETCRSNYAHIKPEWEFDDHKRINMDRVFLSQIDFNNKTVLDYGCGGGFWGKMLFEHYNIKKYHAVDIAERSLKISKQNLSGFNCSFHLMPIDFNLCNADIFLSIAVIQHFPDKEYLDHFLDNLNHSGIKDLCLQFRFGELAFDNSYTDGRSPGSACIVPLEYIKDKLSKYENAFKSDVNEKSKGIFTIFRMK